MHAVISFGVNNDLFILSSVELVMLICKISSNFHVGHLNLRAFRLKRIDERRVVTERSLKKSDDVGTKFRVHMVDFLTLIDLWQNLIDYSD